MQQWHPDRCIRMPSELGEAKSKFQKIQEAYSGMVIYGSSLFQDLWFFVPFCKK